MPQQRPNILWIMMDGCRTDALGCYGSPWAQTPHLDQIAANGVCFRNAVVQCPICVPSRHAMKTGQYCHRTGRIYYGDPPEITPTYADSAQDYPNLLLHWTRAGMQPINLSKSSAFQADWDQREIPGERTSARRHEDDVHHDPVHLSTYGWQIGGTQDIHVDDTAEALLTEQAVGILEERAASGDPFFLRVSYQPPHVPIRVPPPFMMDPDTIDLPWPTEVALAKKPRFEREQLRVYAGTLDLSEEQLRIARATYYGMVSMIDYFIGKLVACLEQLGLRDNTIVAFSSDHGQALGENGLHKKRNFYDPVIRAPLLLSWPGRLPQGMVLEEGVEMIDFLPTLMALSGMTPPGDIAGCSLLPLIRGEAPGREVTFAEIDYSGSLFAPLRERSGRRVMARTADWKLEYFKDPRVAEKDGSLYNLKEDPWEQENLYYDPGYRGIIIALETAIDAWDQVPMEPPNSARAS